MKGPSVSCLLLLVIIALAGLTPGAASSWCAGRTLLNEGAAAPDPVGFLGALPAADALTPRHMATESVALRYPSRSDASVGPSSRQQTNCPHITTPGLRPWSLAFNGNAPPADGSPITLPANTNVIISTCSLLSSTYGYITIPSSSALIFDDAGPIELNTQGILVLGELKIGGPTCRLRSAVTITLHGAAPSTGGTGDAGRGRARHPVEHHKGIVAQSGGKIDIHGELFFRSWTRLAATVSPGDTVVYLQEKVNWPAGAEIAVTTTELKDEPSRHHNEVVTLARAAEWASAEGIAVLTLAGAGLQYDHFGGRSYQAEVGLLSRRIVIQGDASSAASDALESFGGHVMVAGPGSEGRFAGVEFVRMGQTNIEARYPVHWHLVGSGAGSNTNYVQDCSIHRSFFRCVVVHGTDHVRVSRNVAFDVTGHCFYIEDGVEAQNTFEYNLAALVHPIGSPGNLQSSAYSNARQANPADYAAAGFYITNANNRFVGNAASGGFAGFAFPQLPEPIKQHHSDPNWSRFEPDEEDTLEFDGNSCHSSGWYSRSLTACVYIGGKLDQDSRGRLAYIGGRIVGGRSAKIDLSNTKIFLSYNGMVTWGQQGDVRGLEIHACLRGGRIFGKVRISNVLVECSPGPDGHRPVHPLPSGRVGLDWYDVGQTHIASDWTARNCDGASGSYAWGYLSHSSRYVPSWMHSTKNVRYENTITGTVNRQRTIQSKTVRPTEYSAVGARLNNWYDYDGSAFFYPFGQGIPVLAGSGHAKDWWRLDQQCKDGRQFSNDKWWVCNGGGGRSIASIRLTSSGENHNRVGDNGPACDNSYTTPRPSNPCDDIGYVAHWGQEEIHGRLEPMGITLQTRITGPQGHWYVHYFGGAPTTLEIQPSSLSAAIPLVLATSYPLGTTFTVTRSSAATSIDAVRRSSVNKYYFDGRYLYLRIVTSNAMFSDSPSGISMPIDSRGPKVVVQASCADPDGNGYCDLPRGPRVPDGPCKAEGKRQVGIDLCEGETLPTGPEYVSPAPSRRPTPRPTTGAEGGGGAASPAPTPPPTMRPTPAVAPTPSPTMWPTLVPTPTPPCRATLCDTPGFPILQDNSQHETRGNVCLQSRSGSFTSSTAATIQLDVTNASLGTTPLAQYPAEKCVDGDISNFCHGGNGDWLKLDLGSTMKISAVKIWNRDSRSEFQARFGNYVIETRSDAATQWQACFTGTLPPSFGPFEETCNATARYVRVRQTGSLPSGEIASDSDRWFNLAEVSVWGPRHVCPDGCQAAGTHTANLLCLAALMPTGDTDMQDDQQGALSNDESWYHTMMLIVGGAMLVFLLMVTAAVNVKRRRRRALSLGTERSLELKSKAPRTPSSPKPKLKCMMTGSNPTTVVEISTPSLQLQQQPVTNKTAVVLWSFKATHEDVDEVTVWKGETVIVLDDHDENWTRIRRKPGTGGGEEEEGFVPTVFLKCISSARGTRPATMMMRRRQDK